MGPTDLMCILLRACQFGSLRVGGYATILHFVVSVLFINGYIFIRQSGAVSCEESVAVMLSMVSDGAVLPEQPAQSLLRWLSDRPVPVSYKDNNNC